MKKILLIGVSLFAVLCANAQQFWIENWTGTTAHGQLTYTGPNGAWSVQQTGTNDVDSNAWYFSNQEDALGRGQCGTNGNTNGTAHMGNTANAPLLGIAGADNGAIIDDGANTTTNLRLQSPVINCTGKSNIKLSFNYIQGKSAGANYITVQYYNGTSWALLSTPAELDSCNNAQGHWTYYSVALPASANNNAGVRIGFNWTNGTSSQYDNDFLGSSVEMVSFAVDSVVLSVAPTPPVTAFTVSDTLVCLGDSVQFTDQSTNTPTSWAWTFTGGTPATSTLQNPWVKYTTAGYYNVKLKSTNGGGSDSLTKTNYIHAKNCTAGIASITDNNALRLYPNPTNGAITLSFANAMSGNVKVNVTDITGRLVNTQVLNPTTGKTISMNISGIAAGVYILKVNDGNNVYVKQFIKQ